MIIKRTMLIALCLMITLGNQLWAQCAMCRAAVENNVSEGSMGFSAGLNTGILYLFVAPYLLVMIIGFLWYKKSRLHGGKDRTTGATGR